RFDETLSEACDHFKDLLRKCPHHDFSELLQIDTLYNTLTQADQDSLNAAASGNLLNHTPRDALTIIENKSKVRTSRNKPIVSNANTTTSSTSLSRDVTTLTEIVKELVLMNKASQQTIVKAIEETYVTCGGLHPYYECLATGGNTFDDCAAVGTYNQRELKNEFKTTMLNQNNKLKSMMSNELKNMMNNFIQMQSPLGSGSLPSNTIANPRDDVEAITTRSGVAHEGPLIPPILLSRRKGNENLIGIADDVFVQVGKFTFPADFVVIDYDVDPRVPFILGMPFLRTTRALVDVHREELILRDGDEKLIFYADSTSKHPHKHGNELVNMINFIDITCEDHFLEVLKFKKSNHPSSGSTTPFSDSFSSLTHFVTSYSLLEEFANELAPFDPFPSRNEDFDHEADLRKIEYLLNQDPSTKSNIEIIDPIFKKFTDEPALDYSSPPGDDNDDDDDDDDFLTLSLIMMNRKSFCMVTFTRTLTLKMIKTRTLK
nr:reverse transcriptase domain-containing protein [Tanacetum cinerariifolium]